MQALIGFWALGVILYEFLYGFPPFHAPTPQEVFENILARRINWHEDDVELSPECRDLLERLMCTSIESRLGYRGAEEVKRHPFFADVKWETLHSSEASFVPKPANAEDTDYFDDRGAANSKLSESELKATLPPAVADNYGVDVEEEKDPDGNGAAPPSVKGKERGDVNSDSDEEAPDFGEFVYKNLPLLEKANSDLVKKLRSDLISLDFKGSYLGTSAPSSGISSPGSLAPPRGRSRNLSMSEAMPPTGLADLASGSSGGFTSPLNPGTPPHLPSSGGISSLTQEIALKSKQRFLDDGRRRNSLPSRLRTQSFGAFGTPTSSPGSGTPTSIASQASAALIPPGTPSESAHRDKDKRHSTAKADDPASYLQNAKLALRQSHGLQVPAVTEPSAQSSSQDVLPPGPFGGRPLDVLIADDNPVACKILESMLTKMNCRCVVVRNGSEALRYAIGEVKFDVIFMDIRMPIIDGETASRMIKSTTNINQFTPIIAVTAYEQTFSQSQQFDDVMSKPVTKDLLHKVLAAVAGDPVP
ncbi:hypothetical protein HDU96_001204 [Phlyctochytrium bullatum]|nr:hypothetical protein HDU96_001204 [Phlyctochytrium bullatum]